LTSDLALRAKPKGISTMICTLGRTIYSFISILSPTTLLPGKGGEWWVFEVKSPTRGAQRVFKSPHGKVGYSAAEAKLIL